MAMVSGWTVFLLILLIIFIVVWALLNNRPRPGDLSFLSDAAGHAPSHEQETHHNETSP
jgi:hypothetical protein